MERIQSAIQKAREVRQQSTVAEDAATPRKSSMPSEAIPGGSYPAAPEVSIDQLWARLPKMKLEPRQLQRARIISDQAGATTAPFDVLRTRIMHQIRTNNWRRIAITSPAPACGKTTLCMNLAFSFARQRATRTMVIDLDMRRPSIEKILRQKEQHKFASALEGNSAPEEHMVCFSEKLIFATNHKPIQNPAELLQYSGTAHVIDKLEERYKPDVMLFDTPPMLACDDAYAFLDQIDCVLLIAAAETTTADELEKCEREITTRCNLMGVVLNKCRYLDEADSYVY